MKRKKVVVMYALITLSTLAIFMVSIYSTFAWFSYVENTLGNINFASVDVTILGSLNPLRSENGLIITGETIPNAITLLNENAEGVSNQEWVMVRIKSTITIGDESTSYVDIIFPETESFTYDGDYFYLNRALAPSESIQVVSGVRVSDDLGIGLSGQNVDGQIVIECIQAKYGAYKELWTEAPLSWVKQVGLQAYD